LMLSPARGVFAGMRSVRVRHACGVRWIFVQGCPKCIVSPQPKHETTVVGDGYPLHQNMLVGFVKISQVTVTLVGGIKTPGPPG